MISRRNVLALAGVAALTGCGGASGPPFTQDPPTEDQMQLVSSKLPRTPGTPAASAAATKAVTALTADLFGSLASSTDGNLVCSPCSVAIALGMTVTGAKGITAEQMLGVLHSQDAAQLADGLNALDQALATRSTTVPGLGGGKPQAVVLAAANSLWGQRDFRWQAEFLDVLARDFGTGMRTVAYSDPEAARSLINAWVAEQTRTRIPALIPPGAITIDTRLTLVNALYLKAPWQTPFDTDLTKDAPFHQLDGSAASTKMMKSIGTYGYSHGPNWTAASLPYAGGDLAMAVVVPEPGQFAAVAEGITGSWLTQVLSGFEPVRIVLRLPRWTMRTQAELTSALSDLGMTTAFTDAADFTGMTTQEPLQVSAVVHEGFIAVDEAGTEAAAATAVIMRTLSLAVDPPTSVIADRPFFFVIHDVPTRTPLFIGKVTAPATT